MSDELLQRSFSEELSAAEQTELRAWLKSNASHRRAFVLAADLDQQLRSVFVAPVVEMPSPRRKPRRPRGGPGGGTMAVLIGTVALGAIAYAMWPDPPTPVSPVSAPAIDPLVEGLIAHWSFDQDGDTARDVIGGHHGQLQGDARILPTAGRRGGSASFDGDGDRILIGNPPELRLTGAMTLAAWIKPGTLDQGGRIVCKQGYDGQRGWSLNVEPHGVPAFQVGDDLEDGVARVRPQGSAPTLAVGEWTHVVGVFTPGEPMRLYVDGALDAQAERMDLHGAEPKPVPTTGHPLVHQDADLPVCIGARPDGVRAEAPFHGLIDEVRIYERALTSDEVARLYRTN